MAIHWSMGWSPMMGWNGRKGPSKRLKRRPWPSTMPRRTSNRNSDWDPLPPYDRRIPEIEWGVVRIARWIRQRRLGRRRSAPHPTLQKARRRHLLGSSSLHSIALAQGRAPPAWLPGPRKRVSCNTNLSPN